MEMEQGIIWGKFPTSTVKDLTSFPTLSLDFQLFHFFRTPHSKKWHFFVPLKPKNVIFETCDPPKNGTTVWLL